MSHFGMITTSLVYPTRNTIGQCEKIIEISLVFYANSNPLLQKKFLKDTSNIEWHDHLLWVQNVTLQSVSYDTQMKYKCFKKTPISPHLPNYIPTDPLVKL